MYYNWRRGPTERCRSLSTVFTFPASAGVAVCCRLPSPPQRRPVCGRVMSPHMND